MKRWTLWLVAGVLAVLALAAFLLTTDNARDRRVWSRYQQELTADQVTRIEIGHVTPIVLSEEERGRALALLQQGRFQESNRKGHGPTAETILTLHFAGGRTDHIGFWGGDTFELSPRHLDPDTQFLVSSPALGDLIKEKLQP